MLGIAQRHRGGWRSALVTPHPVPTPEPERGESVRTQPPEVLRVLVLFHIRDPGSNTPTSPLILLGDLEARSRGQLAEGRQGWPPVPESQPAEPPISAQGLCYPNTTQRLRLPKAPNSRDSGVPAPTSPRDQGAPALQSKNSGIRALFPSAQ